MDRVAASTLSSQRFPALALGLFCTIALGLAAIGIYGVMSSVVAGRAHEIAIRMALGAQSRPTPASAP
jgi:ABC-type antimicrobial peptide transport system permease subunit